MYNIGICIISSDESDQLSITKIREKAPSAIELTQELVFHAIVCLIRN